MHTGGGQGAESQDLFSGAEDPRLTDIVAGGGPDHNAVSFATRANSCNNKQATRENNKENTIYAAGGEGRRGAVRVWGGGKQNNNWKQRRRTVLSTRRTDELPKLRQEQSGC